MERKNRKKTKLRGLKYTAATIGGATVCLYLSCFLNNPTKNICPITTLITPFFGYEAGLQHQMDDLENYSCDYRSNGNQMSCHVKSVEYKKEEVFYIVPQGYHLSRNAKGTILGLKEIIVAKNKETGEKVQPAITYTLLDDGTIHTVYKAPEGYMLTKEFETVEPLIVEGENAKLIYEYLLSENDQANIFCQSWAYIDGKFINQNVSQGPKLRKYKN